MRKVFLTLAAAFCMLAVSAQPQQGGQGGQMPAGFQEMQEGMTKIRTEQNEALKKIMTAEQTPKFDEWVKTQGQGMFGQRGQGGQGQRPAGQPGQMPQGGQAGPQGGQRGMMDPTARIAAQVEQLNTAVTLTEDQKKQATTIFTDSNKKMQELMTKYMPQRGQGGPQGGQQ